MENRIKTVLLLAGMTAFLLIIGKLLGGRTGMYLAFILAVGMNFFSYWFSDKIVLSMYGAKEADKAEYKQLYALVGNLSSRAGIPMPKVYVLAAPMANAFATGRNPEHSAVAVTESVLVKFRIEPPLPPEGPRPPLPAITTQLPDVTPLRFTFITSPPSPPVPPFPAISELIFSPEAFTPSMDPPFAPLGGVKGSNSPWKSF